MRGQRGDVIAQANREKDRDFWAAGVKHNSTSSVDWSVPGKRATRTLPLAWPAGVFAATHSRPPLWVPAETDFLSPLMSPHPEGQGQACGHGQGWPSLLSAKVPSCPEVRASGIDSSLGPACHWPLSLPQPCDGSLGELATVPAFPGKPLAKGRTFSPPPAAFEAGPVSLQP